MEHLNASQQENLASCVKSAVERFRKEFGGEPAVGVFAPGRVNLIGEHTDYNDGFVLPMALPLITVIVGRVSSSTECRLVSLSCSEKEPCPPFSVLPYPQQDTIKCDGPIWAKYVKGVVALMNKAGGVPAFDAVISSCVPLGGGVSSSAALEVATCLFIEQLKQGGSGLTNEQKALLCQQAEHRCVGNKCGIMDQFISVMAKENHALLIDCRDHSTRDLPLNDPQLVTLVIDTGVRHALVEGEYNARRTSCEEAAKKLGKESLRCATLDDLKACETTLSEIEYKRARHVITEIKRTEDAATALSSGDYATFGKLMNDSHESLRLDYEVSCEELDELVSIAREDKQVYGSRMTGGGFGGCTVTLLPKDRVKDTIQRVKEKYSGTATFYVATASSGAGIVPAQTLKID